MNSYCIIRTQGKTATEAIDALEKKVNAKLATTGGWWVVGNHTLNEISGKWFAAQTVVGDVE